MELTATEWRSLGEAIQRYGQACEARGANIDPQVGGRLQHVVETAWKHVTDIVVPYVQGHPHNQIQDHQATDGADAFFMRYLTTHRIHPAELLAVCLAQTLGQDDGHLLRPRLAGFLRAYRLTTGDHGLGSTPSASQRHDADRTVTQLTYPGA